MDTQWGLETQKNAVIISMAYDDSARWLAISMSDGRVRIIDLPNWSNLVPEEQVDMTETILEDKEIVFPSISPATTVKWCPNRNNQVAWCVCFVYLWWEGLEGQVGDSSNISTIDRQSKQPKDSTSYGGDLAQLIRPKTSRSRMNRQYLYADVHSSTSEHTCLIANNHFSIYTDSFWLH